MRRPTHQSSPFACRLLDLAVRHAAAWVERHRLLCALVAGVCVAAIAYRNFAGHDWLAMDFTWPWRGARYLLAGQNPYHLIAPEGPYPFSDWLYYPLPALIVAAPLSFLPAEWAGALFSGLSSALLAYAVADKPRYWPLFASGAFWYSIQAGQWAPLMMAAVLIPGLGFLLACKPSIGLALALWNDHWRPLLVTLAAMTAFCVLSLPILPSWPLDFLRSAVRMHSHPAAVAVFPGVLLLAVAVRWRQREARLLLALALVPQQLNFYDQLPLFLLARNPKEGLYLAACTWIARLGWHFASRSLPALSYERAQAAIPWVMWCVYVPALALLIWQALRERAPIRYAHSHQPEM